MKVAAIIPARMGSSRFPGKPLANIHGIPMVEHVRRRCLLSDLIDQSIIATCDKEIKEAVEEYGGTVIMTSSSHESCVDRIAEASQHVDADIILNVQGDEPLIQPESLDKLVQAQLQNTDLKCSNLVAPINQKDFLDPGVVKAVISQNNKILYLSREPVPSRQKAPIDFTKFRQLGIIAFQKDFLLKYYKWERTPIEIIESIDMIRVLEHDIQIEAVKIESSGIGVDTEEDLAIAIERLSEDPYLKKYI